MNDIMGAAFVIMESILAKYTDHKFVCTPYDHKPTTSVRNMTTHRLAFTLYLVDDFVVIIKPVASNLLNNTISVNVNDNSSIETFMSKFDVYCKQKFQEEANV